MRHRIRKIHTMRHKIRTFGEDPKFTHSHSFSPSKLDRRPTRPIGRALRPRPGPPLGPALPRPRLRAPVGWDSVTPPSRRFLLPAPSGTRRGSGQNTAAWQRIPPTQVTPPLSKSPGQAQRSAPGSQVDPDVILALDEQKCGARAAVLSESVYGSTRSLDIWNTGTRWRGRWMKTSPLQIGTRSD